MDPGYRRLKYIRYADDHILGFTGPKAEAEEIKARLAEFLRETLELELNQQKTLITHARSQRARFLGYDITVQHSGTKISNGRRSANGKIALKVPPDVIKAQCARYRNHDKPWHRSRLQNLDDYDIIRVYGAEYRGIVNYYLLAKDAWRLRTLRWNAETSMLKTLAAKHQSTVSKMAARHKAKAETGDGPRTCFEARRRRRGKPDLVARFGGIILRQDRRAVITEPVPVRVRVPRRELLARLRQRECELCETGTTVAVHQVAGIRELGKPKTGQPAWAALMAKMRRKTLIVAHRAMTGSTRTRSRTRHKSLESRMPGKRARPVWREAARKRPGSSRMNTGPRRAAHPTRSNDLPGRAVTPSAGRRGPGDGYSNSREVRVMRNAGTVLDVLREGSAVLFAAISTA